jgi:hypothetical protein
MIIIRLLLESNLSLPTSMTIINSQKTSLCGSPHADLSRTRLLGRPSSLSGEAGLPFPSVDLLAEKPDTLGRSSAPGGWAVSFILLEMLELSSTGSVLNLIALSHIAGFSDDVK